MSSISIDIPSLQINQNDLQNLIAFLYKHEDLLKQFGAIKIQLNSNCKLALKKRQKNVILRPITNNLVKTTRNELVYQVKKETNDDIDKSSERCPITTDVHHFWSKLSDCDEYIQPLNISLTNSTSFFTRKTSRSYFDIHRILGDSMLKLAGKNIKQQCIPCVKRAHSAGAIFPLTSGKQRLFTLDYHHEGGKHHWFIIPNSERTLLQRILNERNASNCLEHGQMFIHPSLLDKYHIRYYRCVQQPNEFVVLSAGTLSQSFAESSSWSESTVFALPSWISEGHASIPLPTCQCDLNHFNPSDTIDLTRFTHKLIQQYTNTYLNNKIVNNLTSFLPTKTPDDNSISSFQHSLVTPMQTDISSVQSISNSCSFDNEQYNTHDTSPTTHYQILEQGQFPYKSQQQTDETDFHDILFNENLFETDVDVDSILANLTPSYMNNWDLFSFDDLMDNSLSNIDQTQLINSQTISNTFLDQPLSNSWNQQILIDEQQITDTKMKNYKVLFVSGLRHDVNRRTLQNCFRSCSKVILKQHRTKPNSNYAFLIHRTSRDAQQNLRRVIDHRTLGQHCRIQYSNCRATYSTRILFVKQIPENVTQHDLYQLFPHGQIIEYHPTQIVYKPITKVQKGYAIIRFNTENEAIQVLRHSHQYQINYQQLHISLYKNRKYY